MTVVQKKAVVKQNRTRAIVQFKKWVGTRSWDEISREEKISMFDYFVDRNSKIK